MEQDLALQIGNISNQSTEDENLTIQHIKDACSNSFKEILEVSQTQLAEIVAILQSSENEKRMHMRSHYDQKLNICRVSNRLEREHSSEKSKVEALDIGDKMNTYYKEKIRQCNADLDEYKAARQVQDATLHECQNCLKETQRNLLCNIDKFSTYKGTMEDKCSKLEDELNLKIKQEVWAHFKISLLKKKVKTANDELSSKKKECKSRQTNIKELQSRLKRSIEIREGLERAFERRASIRGRIDILNENNKLERSRPCTRQKKVRRICTDKGTQIFLSRGAEMKDQAVDSPPFYSDQLGLLNQNYQEAKQLLDESNKKRDHAVRQNEAYRRLMSGNNFAMILATKHRGLGTLKPMDAKILRELTAPKGILIEEGAQKSEYTANIPKPILVERKPETVSIPNTSKPMDAKILRELITPQGILIEEGAQKGEYTEKKQKLILVGRKSESVSIPETSKAAAFSISGSQIDTRTEIW